MSKEYVFKLTEEEANVVLNALALRPYMEVAELIGKIHEQAAQQLGGDADGPGA